MSMRRRFQNRHHLVWYLGEDTTPWCVDKANRHARRSQRRRLRQQRGLINYRNVFHSVSGWR